MNFLFLNKLKKVKKNIHRFLNWEITDTIIFEKDIVENQYPDFMDKLDLKDPLICIRDLDSFCIYLNAKDLNTFKKNEQIYREGYINITKLLENKISQDIHSFIANKTVPQEVQIKELIICNSNDINIYISKIIRIEDTDSLYNDLMNLQLMKDKYHLK